MKIAYIAQSFPPTGYAAAINTYRIVRGLVDRGHELSVFCSGTASKDASHKESLGVSMSEPFNVHYFASTPLPLSIVVPHIFNAFRVVEHQYDLVITQFHLWHLASLAGFLSKSLIGKPWVVRVHDMIPDPTLSTAVSERDLVNSFHGLFVKACYGAFLKNLGKKADRVFVLTTELQNLLRENEYVPEKVAVVPNGVDTSIFNPSVSQGHSVDRKTILYIGGMMPEDGLDSLVKAFARLDQEELHLTFIGEGPERLLLMELVKKLNLEARVSFHRYVPHRSIPEFIGTAYIGIGPLRVSPINYYTIPTKILEYFACSKPVVSASVSSDILLDGFTGFAVKQISPENIAERLSILVDDEKLTREMGNNARRLVAERFDWEKIIDQIDEEIRDIGPR